MIEQHVSWYTRHLNRDFEMLVFGESGYPVILFPPALGRFHQAKDQRLVATIAPLIDAGKIKLYCPDAIDEQSWYNKSLSPADRVRTHEAYENVILQDLVPQVLQETGRKRACVAGVSFGGYHAVNFALRHPDLIGYCISLSGTFDVRPFLDNYFDEQCYYHNPVEYLPNLDDAWYLNHLRKMSIVLGTGDRDLCRNRNLRFSELLTAKNIRHFLDDRQNYGHEWKYWREAFPLYLSLISG